MSDTQSIIDAVTKMLTDPAAMPKPIGAVLPDNAQPRTPRKKKAPQGA